MSEPRTPLPTGVVTFLLTDVAGSTRLWESNAEAMTSVIERHYELLHDAVTARGGVYPVEQGEGDSIVAAFARASDAIAAALDAQRALLDEPWPNGLEIAVRMALHTGEARLRDPRNYVGETIIRTARLRSLANGGQVIASRACIEVLGDQLPDGAAMVPLGSYRLKNLGRPEEVFQLDHPDLPSEFGPLHGIDQVANNLPTQVSPFIGREDDLAQVQALLDDSRLLTLTGSGGCGKTRLALQAAAERIDRHADGVWFVELAPVTKRDGVLHAVADAVTVAESVEQSLLDGIVARLECRAALLLIDNCEHLIDETASVVAELLARCPDLQVLATSRQHLNLPGEVTWRVPSMPVPEVDDTDIASIEQFDAVALFIDRAMRARPNFQVTNDNAPCVAAICHRLAGIPLAIELAAARVRSVSVERIAAGLDDSLRLLTGGSGAAQPRQQTLEASIAWSHDLLESAEQTLLRRLSVFSGGFTLDAAEAVCAFGDLGDVEVLDRLGGLVDKSLVTLDDVDGADRYHVLETIKQFAARRLDEADERSHALDRLLDWVEQLDERMVPWLEGPRADEARRVLVPEHDNLRVALDHAVAVADPTRLAELVFSTTHYWHQIGRFGEADTWFVRAIEALGDELSPIRARLLWARGFLAFYWGDFVTSVTLAEEAVEVARSVDDPLALGRALNLKAYWYSLCDPLGELPTIIEAHDRCTSCDDVWGAIDAAQKAGESYMYADHFEESRLWLDKAFALFAEEGNPFFEAWHWNSLMRGAMRRGEDDRLEIATRGVAAGERSAEPVTVAWAVRYHALFLTQNGDHAGARALLDHWWAIFAERGIVGLAASFLEMAEAECEITGGDYEAGAERLRAILPAYESVDAAYPVADLLDVLLRSDLALDHPGFDAHLAAFVAAGGRLESGYVAGKAALYAAMRATRNGDPDTGAEEARRSLERLRDGGFAPATCEALDVLAWACSLGGDPEGAGRWAGAAESERGRRGWGVSHSAQAVIDATRSSAVVGSGFQDGLDAGRLLALDDAVTMALRSRGRRLRPSSGWPSLTPTELEVVACVVEGLSNPQIADRLLMSRSTVKTHLAHVFGKLAVSSRTELAAAAARRDAS